MKRLVNIKQNPNIMITGQIENYFAPEFIYVFDNSSNYKINDYVYKNTRFTKGVASISGVIKNIKKEKGLNKITIQNDYKENSLKKPRKEIIKNKDQLLKFLEKKGETRLLEIFSKDKIKDLVVSAIDEEIYTASETITLEHNYRLILDTFNYLLKTLGLEKGILFIKSTNFKSIKKSNSIIGSYPNIKIILAPDLYLIGRRNFLCEYLNLPANNTITLKIADIIKINNVLNNRELVEKYITITNNETNTGMVVNTRLGISISSILNEFNLDYKDLFIYINGLLKKKIVSEDYVIDESVDSIVLTKKKDNKASPCINCGACRRICPFNINVRYCYENKLYSKRCINCGLCSFVCPVNINLQEILYGGEE